MSETFAQLNPKTRLIEIVDMQTGMIVAVQRDYLPLLQERSDFMVERVLPDGSKILVQTGIDPGLLAHTESWPFSQTTVDIMCQLVAQGSNITDVCERGGGIPPYSVWCTWRRRHPEINEQLDRARHDRAEYYRDQVVKTAEAAVSSKDPLQAAALQVDAYKWAAGMDNSRYSPKTKVEATLNTPLQIIVHTGIDRTPIDVTPETKELDESN